MMIFFSERQLLHNPDRELTGGELVPSFEKPERARMIAEALARRGFPAPVAPHDFGLAPIEAVHKAEYLEFLRGAWAAWVAEYGAERHALPSVWPSRAMRDVIPDNIDGALGYYALDAGTPIMEGTWLAAYASAQTALSGAEALRLGEKRVFSLCRPPGHHAAADVYGGYCFLNNSAIAARRLCDQGAARVAILDVDYHHGNGAQAIFHERSDVLTISIHADPEREYPYFLGRADETGAGAGAGLNVNYPLPWGTGWATYRVALHDALERIASFAPDALVAPLGVDTYRDDPISRFELDTPDFRALGRMLGSLDLPTLVVMEGGYAVAEIGENVATVLMGLDEA